MKYLHTMIRVSDPEETLRFFSLLGLEEVRRMDNEQGRYTLIFLAAPGDEDAQIELTHNWDEAGYGEGRNFGHVAYEVDDVYETCPRLMDGGRHHQPAAARGPDGVRPHARRHLDRAAAEGRPPAGRRALGVDAQYGALVMLEIVPVPVLRDNYVWLVHDPASGETVAVDPSVADPVLAAAAARGWRITQVWNTHWHPDHTGGNDAIRAATGCAITGPAEAERVSRMDRIVAGGDRARIGGIEAS